MSLELDKSFLECIVDPEFTDNAIKILTKNKNLRLITIDKDKIISNRLSVKSVFNGYLFQDKDTICEDESGFSVVSKIKPKKSELKAFINDKNVDALYSSSILDIIVEELIFPFINSPVLPQFLTLFV